MFSLVQSEQGDLFRVRLLPREQGVGGVEAGNEWAGGPGRLEVRLLDTIPPVNAPLLITNRARLFAPCEGHDPLLLRFTSLGDVREGEDDDGWEVIESIGRPDDEDEADEG